jgi:hypothetical protein
MTVSSVYQLFSTGSRLYGFYSIARRDTLVENSTLVTDNEPVTSFWIPHSAVEAGPLVHTTTDSLAWHSYRMRTASVVSVGRHAQGLFQDQ